MPTFLMPPFETTNNLKCTGIETNPVVNIDRCIGIMKQSLALGNNNIEQSIVFLFDTCQLIWKYPLSIFTDHTQRDNDFLNIINGVYPKFQS